jgi:hypothetical protein
MALKGESFRRSPLLLAALMGSSGWLALWVLWWLLGT